MTAVEAFRRRLWELQHIECPSCRQMALARFRPPAPDPSPQEQAEIDRFGIFDESAS